MLSFAHSNAFNKASERNTRLFFIFFLLANETAKLNILHQVFMGKEHFSAFLDQVETKLHEIFQLGRIWANERVSDIFQLFKK